jgi:TolB protein
VSVVVALSLALALAALVVPTAAPAAYPGSNGRTFFSHGGAIFSIKPDGSDRQLVVDPGLEPAVSADGKTIVFRRGRNLFTANRFGDDVRRVTDTPKPELTPSFSPSGNKIVYSTDQTAAEPAQIFTVRVDGTDRTQLTHGKHSSLEPEYSPNGNRIVFTKLTPLESQLFVMDADGGNVAELTPSDLAARSPSWSGNGDAIAFEEGNTGSIGVVRPNSSGEILEVITGPHRDHEPAFAPSGNGIVFRGERNDRTGLFVIGIGVFPGSIRVGSMRALITVPAAQGAPGFLDPYWAPAP